MVRANQIYCLYENGLPVNGKLTPMLNSRILIVDDNPVDHMITAHVLKTYYQRCDIVVMESASEALHFLEANKENRNELPSLIILDLDMPGLNGIKFLEQFSRYTKELRDSCKIVVLTASEVVADLETMKADPHVVELITKPLRRSSLTSVIGVA